MGAALSSQPGWTSGSTVMLTHGNPLRPMSHDVGTEFDAAVAQCAASLQTGKCSNDVCYDERKLEASPYGGR